MKKFIAWSLLFHLLVFLSSSLFKGQQRSRKGSLFSVSLAAHEDITEKKKSDPDPTDYGASRNLAGTLAASLAADAWLTLTAPDRSPEEGPHDSPPLARRDGYGSPRGYAGPPDSATGTRICDNFQASIPVFLCNAKMYFEDI